MKSLKESLVIESRFNLSQDNAYLLAACLSMYMNGDIKKEDIIKAAKDSGGNEAEDAVKRMLDPKNEKAVQGLEDDLYNVKF